MPMILLCRPKAGEIFLCLLICKPSFSSPINIYEAYSIKINIFSEAGVNMIRKKGTETNNKKERNLFTRSFTDMFSENPNIEISSNTYAIIEGSRGVMEYSDKIIRINLGSFSVAFIGRGLSLKCISPTSLEIEGFFTDIEFSL